MKPLSSICCCAEKQEGNVKQSQGRRIIFSLKTPAAKNILKNFTFQLNREQNEG